jgi:hyperosmotically inducible protein
VLRTIDTGTAAWSNQYRVHCSEDESSPDRRLQDGDYFAISTAIQSIVYGRLGALDIALFTWSYRSTEGNHMTLDNKKMLRIVVLGIGIAGISVSSVPAFAWQQADLQAQPDNTKQNKGDREKGAMTADQQKETAADRGLAKKIRKSIASDSSLSTYAHNVKIIVRDGMVTLKGPVHTEDEKNAIGAKASEVAGADKVQNELTVKGA